MPRIDYATTPPAKHDADLLVLPVFEGPEEGPGLKEAGRAMGEDLLELLRSNGVRGKRGDAFSVPTFGRLPAGTLLLVGLGKRDEVDADRVRRVIGKLAPRLHGYRSVATSLPQAARGGWEEAVQAAAEGFVLGGYRFLRYKKDEDERKLRRLTLLGTGRWDEGRAKRAVGRGETVAEAACWARDLVNTPAIDATPEFLAAEARKMARETGLEVKVWTKRRLEEGGFGGILGVGSGSANDPRLIELTYSGGRGKPIALAGKGITFDSGGLSLKDAKQMEWMKADMSGAAAVMATMRAIAELKPKVNVVAAIPSAENMPGGAAIRPGDVLRHRGGKTTEVLNTDAEGRLILADALAYLAERKPRLIVDAATLTGACMIALGDQLYGVMSNDDDLARELVAAGGDAGEPGWQLPLWDGYREQVSSTLADVKNIGSRYGGAINAALYLSEFVGDIPWAHLDIAGVAYAQNGGDYGKGATGIPVRTLVRFVLDRAGR
ncbi:MAG TPA: leucyl aminopeptidase [Actinomycetota bacterium]